MKTMLENVKKSVARSLRSPLSGGSWALPFALFVTILVLVPIVVTEVSSLKAPEKRDLPAALFGLENADVGEVDRTLKERREAIEALKKEEERRAEREALSKALDDGTKDVWSLFEDYVILGDSRAVGFWYFDFLPESRVLASGGNNITAVYDRLESIKAIHPSYIYLCYGLNDTGVGYWANADEYEAELYKAFGVLREALPDAKLIASSILPATESALQRSPVWRKIDSFDEALERVCRDVGAVYVDNDALAEQYMERDWQPDGVHVAPEFYPLWAKNLVLAALYD